MAGNDQICPECRQGKHRNCDGLAWDFDIDKMVDCRCPHCTEGRMDVWTCPRCESDHKTGEPEDGCPDCGWMPEVVA